MKYYSSICLLAKNENDYINEWIEWHLNKLKFDHIYIYDNESIIPLEETVEDKYKEFITFIKWTKNDYGLIMQNDCYSHFLKNYSKENEWTAFIDADEFIRLIESDNINSFLADYEDVNGIFIEWLMYNADGQYKKTDGLVRDRFKTYIEYKGKIFNGKCIIKSNKFTKMYAHYPESSFGYNVVYSNKKTIDKIKNNAPLDKIVIDHYFTKSYEEWCEKIARGSCNISNRCFKEFFIFNPDMNNLK
jgi:hypothetical protein